MRWDDREIPTFTLDTKMTRGVVCPLITFAVNNRVRQSSIQSQKSIATV